MKNMVGTLFNAIDWINERIGRHISLLLIIMMLLVVAATLSRYLLGKPIPIVWPFIRQVFGVMVLFGAAYALKHNLHIRIEILYDMFPMWLKKVSDLVSLALFLMLTGCLIWQGILMAKMSIMLGEVSRQSSHIPIYPFKILLPIATFLFLLQGISYFLRKKSP